MPAVRGHLLVYIYIYASLSLTSCFYVWVLRSDWFTRDPARRVRSWAEDDGWRWSRVGEDRGLTPEESAAEAAASAAAAVKTAAAATTAAATTRLIHVAVP